jgi:glutamate racemase
MMNKKQPIGVFDAGIGGLRVLAELQKVLPNEDILYFGDSANNPYGSRPIQQILQLNKVMVDFLAEQKVKVGVIACNTLSTLMDYYKNDYSFPFVGIVEPAAAYAAGLGMSQVGLIATETTVNQQTHAKITHSINPKVEIIGSGSPHLARLVDRGDFNREEIDAEITEHMDHLLTRAKVSHVILGCTHYPVVMENFRRLYPNIIFINPAHQQAAAVKKLLEEKNGLNEQRHNGHTAVYTNGNPDIYKNVLERLGAHAPNVLEHIDIGILRA